MPRSKIQNRLQIWFLNIMSHFLMRLFKPFEMKAWKILHIFISLMRKGGEIGLIYFSSNKMHEFAFFTIKKLDSFHNIYKLQCIIYYFFHCSINFQDFMQLSIVPQEDIFWQKNESYQKKSTFVCISLARFIWNAEISVSVAIHCYECLF